MDKLLNVPVSDLLISYFYFCVQEAVKESKAALLTPEDGDEVSYFFNIFFCNFDTFIFILKCLYPALSASGFFYFYQKNFISFTRIQLG